MIHEPWSSLALHQGSMTLHGRWYPSHEEITSIATTKPASHLLLWDLHAVIVSFCVCDPASFHLFIISKVCCFSCEHVKLNSSRGKPHRTCFSRRTGMSVINPVNPSVEANISISEFHHRDLTAQSIHRVLISKLASTPLHRYLDARRGRKSF